MKKATRKQRFIGLPGLRATSCFTVVLFIFLETVLLSTVSNCANTYFMHWNTSNSIFRIDNTDHIIDVNRGNLAFEYDQVHIICPVYEPGTFDNETEKYIIYNVSKVEYETCRITNANPRIIAICDKPQKLMYFTITFRPFTPQPGGLEFLPGNDYYFISTSSKDDLHRRIGGRCSTNNMKVVFKVCCAPEPDSQNVTLTSAENGHNNNINSNDNTNNNSRTNNNQVSQQQNGGKTNQYSVNSNSRGTSINTDTQSSNSNGRIPPLTINTSNGGNIVQSTMTWLSRNGDSYGGNGNGNYPHSTPITSTISVQQYYPHPTSSRPFINSAINKNKNNNNYNKNNSNNNYNHSNFAPSHKPTKKTNEYDKHPNEVVKNEELTYNNNGGISLMGPRARHTDQTHTSFLFSWMPPQLIFILITLSIVFLINYLTILQTKLTIVDTDNTLRAATAAAATVTFIKREIDVNERSNGHTTLSDYPSKTSGSQLSNGNFNYKYDNYDVNLSDNNKTNQFDKIFNQTDAGDGDKNENATVNRPNNITNYNKLINNKHLLHNINNKFNSDNINNNFRINQIDKNSIRKNKTIINNDNTNNKLHCCQYNSNDVNNCQR